MPYQPPIGKSKWRSEMADVRGILRKQRRLIAEHLDGRIDEDLLLTAVLTLNTQADNYLEHLENKYSDDNGNGSDLPAETCLELLRQKDQRAAALLDELLRRGKQLGINDAVYEELLENLTR